MSAEKKQDEDGTAKSGSGETGEPVASPENDSVIRVIPDSIDTSKSTNKGSSAEPLA